MPTARKFPSDQHLDVMRRLAAGEQPGCLWSSPALRHSMERRGWIHTDDPPTSACDTRRRRPPRPRYELTQLGRMVLLAAQQEAA